MSDTIFLELEDHIGIEPPELPDGKPHPNAGEPGPLVEEGCAYVVPTLIGNDVVGLTRHVKIRPSEGPVTKGSSVSLDSEMASDARIIPGTRRIETVNPLLANVLEQGGYKRCDPPKSQKVAAGRGASSTDSQEG